MRNINDLAEFKEFEERINEFSLKKDFYNVYRLISELTERQQKYLINKYVIQRRKGKERE